jgi:uncharacterized protein (DUF302 family)
MKLLGKIVASVALASSLFASDVVVYKMKDSAAINYKTVSAVYKTMGFSVDAVSKLDKKFKKKFNDTTFDKFKIMAVYNKGLAKKLLIKYPDAGAFLPYSVVLQSYANSDDVTLSTLNVDTMKKVLNIKDEVFLDKLENKNNKIATMFGFDVSKAQKFDYEVAKPEGDLLFKKQISGDAASLAKKLTDTMKKHKFSIVNELNFAKRYKVVGAKYDYYTTFSICKVKVLYQAAKTRPEAAAFAPCSLAIYKEKGSDKVTIAFPSTYNWLSSLNMKDPKAVKILNDEQKEIEGFINSL